MTFEGRRGGSTPVPAFEAYPTKNRVFKHLEARGAKVVSQLAEAQADKLRSPFRTPRPPRQQYREQRAMACVLLEGESPGFRRIGRMSPLLAQVSSSPTTDKALKIIARSLFKELKHNGYDSKQIVSLSTELIGLVTTDLQKGPTIPAQS